MDALRYTLLGWVCLLFMGPPARAAVPDTTVFESLMSASRRLVAIKRLDSAEVVLVHAYALAGKANNRQQLLKAAQELSVVQFGQLKYRAALVSSQRMLKWAKALGDHGQEANAYNNISLQYHALGDLRLAADFLIRALHVADGVPHVKNLQKFYSNLASVFIDLKDGKNSYRYAKQGYELAKAQRDSLQTAKSLVNLSASEVIDGRYGPAREHLLEMQSLARLLRDTGLLVHACLNLGDVAIRCGRHGEALRQYQKASDILEKAPDRDYGMYAWSGLANAYFLLKQYGEARSYFERLRPVADEYMPKNDLLDVYVLGAGIYAEMGQFKKAYKLEKLYDGLKDSVLDAETQKTTHELEAKYQLSQKEKAMVQQQLALKLSRDKIREKDRYILLGGVAVVLLLCLVLVAYLLYRNKAQFMQLSLLKAQIHPHFLFNTLNNLYALSLAKSSDTPQVVLGLSEILRYILYECNDTKGSLQREVDIIERYLSLERIRYRDRLEINYKVRGDHRSQTVVPLLLLPLVENAFKHGIGEQVDEGWINISSNVGESEYTFKISNSKPLKTVAKPPSAYGRIGLNNIKRRLHILYPHKHKLLIADEDEMFMAVLKLKLT